MDNNFYNKYINKFYLSQNGGALDGEEIDDIVIGKKQDGFEHDTLIQNKSRLYLVNKSNEYTQVAFYNNQTKNLTLNDKLPNIASVKNVIPKIWDATLDALKYNDHTQPNRIIKSDDDEITLYSGNSIQTRRCILLNFLQISNRGIRMLTYLNTYVSHGSISFGTSCNDPFFINYFNDKINIIENFYNILDRYSKNLLFRNSLARIFNIRFHEDKMLENISNIKKNNEKIHKHERDISNLKYEISKIKDNHLFNNICDKIYSIFGPS